MSTLHPGPVRRSSSSLLERLPTELLVNIKNEIGDYELMGHVGFSRAIARTAALYSEDDWERYCRGSGIGRSVADRRGESWYEVAAECAGHASYCRTKGCGRRRLTQNGQIMREYVEQAEDHNVLDVVTASDPREIETVSNKVFQHIDFSADASIWMMGHPIVERSFATFPPINAMVLMNLPGPVVEASCEGGITVSHVIEALDYIMDTPLEIQDAIDLIDDYGEPDIPTKWSIRDVMRSFKTLKGWFRVMNFVGFEEDFGNGATDGQTRWFIPTFQPYELPEEYESQDSDY